MPSNDKTRNVKIPSPFKKAFIYPVNNEDNHKAVKEILPSIASSNAWLVYNLRKKTDKDTIELAKLDRERKKVERKNQKPQNQHQSKKIQKKSTIPETVTKINFNIGNFVIFKYEEVYYPGVIVAVIDQKVLISAMVSSGTGWKWPEKEDRLWYDEKDIFEKIEQPKAKNNRGAFDVPEILKWQ